MKNPNLLEITFSFFFACLFLATGCTDKSATNEVATAQNLILHPLNPLDTNEIHLARQILLEEGKIDTAYRFYLINLNEIKKYVRGDGGYVIMNNDKSLDVSKRKKEGFLSRIGAKI